MESTAIAKSVRISPRKARLVADTIRNLSVSRALDVLTLSDKRAATSLEKALKSALANAMLSGDVDYDSLTITRVEVNEGPALKRYRPSTRGRIHPYKKKSSHIKIVLTGKEKTEVKPKTSKKAETKGADVETDE